jgi:L-lactate dehydrogenase complex protein LldG
VPSGLLFLAEALLVIVHVDDIYPRYEDLWQSAKFLSGKIPRAVHLITGPSRTADVEQTIQIGAHGPRELFIAVIDQRV